MKFMSVDTETGGLDSRKHSLLTVAALLFDDEKPEHCLSAFNVGLSHEVYAVTAEAMKINGIYLPSHDAAAYARDTFAVQLDQFLGDVGPFTLLGHNFPFDRSFLDEQIWLESGGTDKRCGRDYVDTRVLLKAANVFGKVKTSSCSLAAGCEYFGILPPNHTAMRDADKTWKLFCALRKVLA